MTIRIKKFSLKKNSGAGTFSLGEPVKKSSKLYDRKWQKYRARFLHHNKLCYVCHDPAKHVDHIVPHKNELDLFWKVDNYVPLCHRDHSIVTGRFDKSEIPNTEDKIRWMNEQRQLRSITRRVVIVPFKGENK